MTFSIWRSAAVTTLAALLVASTVQAQTTTGEIQGTVADQSGALIPGVSVTVANTATGVMRELVTDADGRFAAPGLQVGPYEVTAALQGFATRRQEGLRVQLGETVTLRLELGVAAVADTITVSGTPPVLETTRSQMSSTVECRDHRQPAGQRPQLHRLRAADAWRHP